ncbi:MAG: hypothetical protein INQ03_13695 [Candidatus Heimdallarchaeota archaeon]|nr:hypothetical protein [Candidatus Heimdallarchaeota archaeon]
MGRKAQVYPVKSFKSFLGIIFILFALFGYVIIANPERVSFTEYGLAINIFTSEVKEEVYEPGLYHVGPTWDIKTFDKTFNTIDFTAVEYDEDDVIFSAPLVTRTIDGLGITLEISFQWKITKNGLRNLYLEYKDNYPEQVIRVARAELRDISSLFAGVDFFSNRTLIGDTQEQVLADVLSSIDIELGGFQLKEVDLPDDFEEKLKELEKARQDVLIALERQKQAIIEAETKLLVAKKEAEAEIIRANGSAQAFLIETKAQAEAVSILLNATGDALYNFATIMGFNSTEMLAYLWIDALLKIGEYGNMIIITENTPMLATIDTQTNSTG